MKHIFKIINICILCTTFFISFKDIALGANASISITGGGNTTLSQNINMTVSVYASSSYNAVDMTVNFTNLTFISATPQGWTPVSGPNSGYGTVSFSGATLGNSYSGSKSVLNLSFKTTSFATNYSISANGSIALADGSGSKVPANSQNYTYTNSSPQSAATSSPAPPTSTPMPTQLPTPGAIDVSSTTHSDQNKWYQASNVVLNWNKSNDISGFAFTLDQNPNSTINQNDAVQENSKTFTNLPSRISYFKLQAKNSSGWGAISTFNIRIDNIPPDPFTITKTSDDKGYKIFFATNDLLSGVSRYQVLVDNVDKGAQSSGYIIPKNSTTVVVTAFDNAGNSTISNMNVTATRVVESTATNQIITTKNDASTKSNLPLILLIIGITILGIGIIIVVGYIKFKNHFKFIKK